MKKAGIEECNIPNYLCNQTQTHHRFSQRVIESGVDSMSYLLTHDSFYIIIVYKLYKYNATS